MYDMWLMTGLLMVLVVMSIFDIKTKKIPIWILVVISISGITLWVVGNDKNLSGLMMSLVPGAIMTILSIVTKEKVGMGDAIVITCLGIGLGLEKCSFLVMIALFANFFFAGIMFLMKKVNRSTQLPFIPFITLGMGVMILVYL